MRDYIEIVEIMSYQVLLEDRGRVAYLVKTYGPKLEAKWQAGLAGEPDDIKRQIEGGPAENIGQKLIDYISAFDPSLNGQYTQWMLLRYLKNGLRLEDLEAAKEYLATFDQMKAQRELEQSDINAYKTLHDLAKGIGQAQDIIVSGATEEENQMLAQSKILYDGPDCRIFVPFTQAAACYFGRNTGWCTAWGDHTKLGLTNPGRYPTRTNRFLDYTGAENVPLQPASLYVAQQDKKGPLFIIEIKEQRELNFPSEDKLFQYHSETGQFTDVKDHVLSTAFVEALLTQHPAILKVIGEKRFAQSHLRELGIHFFSPKMLENIPYDTLISVINRGNFLPQAKADFEHIPASVRKNPEFLAKFLKVNVGLATQLVPKEDFTPAVAAELRKIVTNPETTF